LQKSLRHGAAEQARSKLQRPSREAIRGRNPQSLIVLLRAIGDGCQKLHTVYLMSSDASSESVHGLERIYVAPRFFGNRCGACEASYNPDDSSHCFSPTCLVCKPKDTGERRKQVKSGLPELFYSIPQAKSWPEAS
jgi:hypothetical protein